MVLLKFIGSAKSFGLEAYFFMELIQCGCTMHMSWLMILVMHIYAG